MNEPLIEMDAFELRWQLVHGLHPSDGLVVHVVDGNTLMVIGTDSTPHPKHGIYLATGRVFVLARREHGVDDDTKFDWYIGRNTPPQGPSREDWLMMRKVKALSDLDIDIAWVRQRS